MRPDVVLLIVVVGVATWALRFLPMLLRLNEMRPDTALSRFLSATGPAAIATLFVASVLPDAAGPWRAQIPLWIGVAAVLGIYGWRHSVVAATLGGALAYGLVFRLLAG